MSADIHIRKDGRAGRITLNRPDALNALTYPMVLAIEDALDAWADDPDITLLLLDATGDRAFCAGGDIADMYESGLRQDWDYGRRFWRDEYRMNAKLFDFPKPVVSFLQGFTMGGGVGVGCHGSHRIVGDTSKIAMPECGIGLIPDVGGSLILARAPGRLGEYLGVTASRMGPGDAILAGFADYYLPEDKWAALKADLVKTGDWTAVDRAASPPPPCPLAERLGWINSHFAGETMADICRSLESEGSEAAYETLETIAKNSPLSTACAIEVIHRVRAADDIRTALEQEYRFTSRSGGYGDFIEGIRAAIIDKDRNPQWQHASWRAVTGPDILKFTLPVKDQPLTFKREDAP